MEFLPHGEFQRCVGRYQADRRLRKLSCWDQWLCLAFAQLTHRESLRDIEACLRGLTSKLYHLGIRGSVARSTLAEANEKRDWRVYADLAQTLLRTARPLYADDPFGVELDRWSMRWTRPRSTFRWVCVLGLRFKDRAEQ